LLKEAYTCCEKKERQGEEEQGAGKTKAIAVALARSRRRRRRRRRKHLSLSLFLLDAVPPFALSLSPQRREEATSRALTYLEGKEMSENSGRLSLRLLVGGASKAFDFSERRKRQREKSD
jgi:hypothetical protein